MVPNPVSLTLKSSLLHRFVGFSPRPTSLSGHLTRIPVKQVQMRGYLSCSSCQSFSSPLNSGHGAVLQNLRRSEMGLGQLGLAHFRVSAVPDGVPGGTGGFGGSGDGNSRGRGEGGAGSDGDGGNNWSLLSWVLLIVLTTVCVVELLSSLLRGYTPFMLSQEVANKLRREVGKYMILGELVISRIPIAICSLRMVKYLALLAKYPVSTKALTSALLTLIGDLICQLVIDQVPSLDWKRTFLFTLLGLVLVGPTLHFWYLYLSRLVTLPGASGAFLRLLLDQFLFSPIFIGVFLATLVTLEGRPSLAIPKLQQEWFSAVLANWKLWIPFQFLNFRFVPQQFQVLAANFIAVVWNVVLSFIAHKEILPRKDNP